MGRSNTEFQTIRSEGGLLPADLLRRILDPREKLPGTRPEDYGLPQSEHLNEVITQSWNRLRKHWVEFRAAIDNLPEAEIGTAITNDKWNLPVLRELGFGLLPTAAGPEIGGRTYAISRFFGSIPIHLVGCRVNLDQRAAGVRGAAALNPHGLVQEFLNRSDLSLWAIVSNGLRFRILRDNQALSRQSFLEFDLEAMFVGEIYSDFVLFWLIAHATRFAPREGDKPETCRLEDWTKLANELGTRALGDLRGGVERALQILGEGFTSHPKNTALREALRSGTVTPASLRDQLLRIVYRLLFLFVAEDRTIDGQSLLHPRDDSEAARRARDRFGEHYSTSRLRDLASKMTGGPHGDLWRQFQIVCAALSGSVDSAAGREHLALPALGSFLWDPASTAILNGAELTNHDFLEALRNLAFTRQGKVLRAVDYKNLGAEELGGVYESLLGLTPQISSDAARFTFAEFAGNERKTSGSYYTPDSLVQCLLDSALDPVVEEAIKDKTGAEAEKAILALKICDPAVGSGHFLVGAAHRLARHLSRVRAVAQGESEPSPLLYQRSLRDVIGRCLYGVDLNPMAAELCRVSLWLEALEPGKPLSFLEHHIRVGNSLLGATPSLIAAGLPDEAFNALEGDDKKACAVLKKRNKSESKGWGPIFAEQDAETQLRLQQAAAALQDLPDDRPEDIRAKELAYRTHERTEEYRHKKSVADAWCAAFVIQKYFSEPGREGSASGLTQGHLYDLVLGRLLPVELAARVDAHSRQYQFFHWHLAFPEVFMNGGFACVIGNPPWEMPEVDDREFFANADSTIAGESSAQKRRALIAGLSSTNTSLYKQWSEHLRRHEGERAFFTGSNRFPNAANGRLNYYKLFVESAWFNVAPFGRLGMVVPSVLTTNAYERPLWHSLVKEHHVACVIDFENKEPLFPSVDGRTKFSLLVLSRRMTPNFLTGCWLHKTQDISNSERVMPLSVADLEKFSPDELALPQFRCRGDLDLLTIATDKVGRLADHPDWTYTPRLMFSSSDSVFKPVAADIVESACVNRDNRRITRNHEQIVPVYEGKMVGILDHRQADIYINRDNPARQAQEKSITDDDKDNPSRFAAPQFWLPETVVRQRRFAKSQGDWELVFCDVTSATNERTALACIIPLSGLTRNLPAIYLHSASAKDAALLVGIMSTFVFDYFVRLKVSSNHLTQGILATAPTPSRDRIREFARTVLDDVEWFERRALELTYTALDLQPFARDYGFEGTPFRWNPERRFLLRCELDAASFHLYLSADSHSEWDLGDNTVEGDFAHLKSKYATPREAAAYVMDTFPIVQSNDIKQYGDYRTKHVILDIYDRMQRAMATGEPYQTLIDPPPADPRVTHPLRKGESTHVGD